jgi:glycosyltransferase 2 family protein
MKTPSFKRVIGVMCLFVLLYGVFAVYQGTSKMGAALSHYRWSTFAAACTLAFGNYVLRYGKWEFYLARLNIRGVPKFESFLIYLSGFVLTVTPGKVGEVFKSAILEERCVPLAKTAPIVIAERVTDVIAIAILIAIGSTAFAGGLIWAAAGLGLVAVLLTVIASKRISGAILGAIEKRSATLGPKLRTAYTSLSTLVEPRNLVVPTLLSCVAWLLECLALWVVLLGFGVDITPPPCLFFYATSTLAGALVPVPGGLGITEGSLLKQMVSLGRIDESIGTAAMILVRFATLWFSVLVGFIALFALRLRKPSGLHDSAQAS